MKLKFAVLVGTFTIGTLIVPPIAPAKAQGVNEFLGSLSGSYRGRGSVQGPDDGGRQSVSCSVKNAVSGATLNVSGSCASTQGKGRVSGRLVASGNKVTGSFISPFRGARVLGSNGTYRNGRMAVITVFAGRGGERVWVRQDVQKTGSGFRARFSTASSAGGPYKPSGSMTFTKR